DVGADVSPPATAPVQPRMNLLALLVRVGSIGDGAFASARRKHCDVLVVPDVSSVALLNFKADERSITAGVIATVRRIDAIAKARPSIETSETLAGARL